MELATAYPPAANIKTWRRVVRLDRIANRVEIEDNYLLTQPTEGVFLSLMTACDVATPTTGTLRLISKQGAPPTTIQFDPSLLKPTVDTIALDNERLVAHWGATVYRIRLKRQTPAASGKLRLIILSA
jgi:hypothetical protein